MNKHLDPELRKQQIIKASLVLFSQKGYENTSVQDILDTTGLSKGGFYHYYASKQELLESIAQSFIREILTVIQEVSSLKDLTALQKINLYVKQVNEYKMEKQVEVMAFLDELYRDDKNIRLERLVFQYTQDQLVPIMKAIIQQGIDEGVFQLEYPEECAELLTRMFLIHQREMGSLFVLAMQKQDRTTLTRIERKYEFLQKTMESMLGVPAGSLNITDVSRSTLQAFEEIAFGKGQDAKSGKE